MVSAGLLAFAIVLAVLAPRMVSAAWADRAPRLAVCAWQATSVGVVLATVLAGLTLLVPATAISGGLAAFLDACATTIANVYSSPGQVPGIVLGGLLAVVVPSRLAFVTVRQVRRDRLERRRLRSSVLLGAHPSPLLGAHVVDSSQAAAFCIPGRHRTIVLTSAALEGLSDEELAGVLAHERAHLRGRHHLPVTAARILGRAFPRLPVFAHARAETERLVELLADDAAAREVDRVEVASALVSLAGMKAPAVVMAAAQAAGAVRVNRLLRPVQPLAPIHGFLAVVTAALVVAAPLAVALWPLLSAASSGLCLLPGEAWWA
ncbi:M56 family metallopeptidase [Blastococcus sp. MG754426]|uniref:M56 family metallopeptidase n=1 Tax=unclassified Blastococcus TaxID=2619396 RepID=UPI001EEFAC87|nr:MULTISPECIES: M56 family metallopeptidase [unclassified Blastococcus]MCF6508792.1 M56 family metallopeptidase [Blastococcus sp. MG754426]MCF6513477.1 M56 family metallopeptidase [Blastococcus sp. MG754427]MCF6736146.1 M56 family metallopeptidase [Blastococcus sp. KM273129]